MDGTAARTEDAELLVARVQELQGRLEEAGESATRDVAEELVSAVVQLYGEGLERIVAALREGGDAGAAALVGLAADPLLATLLLIHDLHPVPLAERVTGALDSVRPYMESHGGNVELLSLDDGVARLRLEGSCSDCSASTVTLELAIKQAIEEAAPDLAGLEVEGVAPQLTGLALPMSQNGPTGIELPMVISGGQPAAPAGAGAAATPAAAPVWVDLDAVADLAVGGLRAVSPGGQPLIVANVDGTLLAYHDECANCGGALREGALTDGALRCPSCERSFFLPRAGRSMDAERIQLRPVPLLADHGSVKVAIAA
jgi:Fe-S cluster biogenesis protein NfuA/nitrite reductase/ring-hydroxylating ferredoxin subunit